MMCQLVIGRKFSLSTNAPSRLVHAHSLGVWYGNEFRKKWIFALDSGGGDERMVAAYSMQSDRASLVFLRTSGEVVSEDHALDYDEDMWESG